MSDHEQGELAAGADPIHTVLDEARELVERLEGTTVQRLSVEGGGYKIEIERGLPPAAAVTGAPAPVSAAAALPTAPEDGTPAAVDDRRPVRAPLVGTFYRATQPGAQPFVEEGQVVAASDPVGLVEAMKLMNEVVAGEAGRVAEIAVENGQWVEFDQVLMYLEPVDG